MRLTFYKLIEATRPGQPVYCPGAPTGLAPTTTAVAVVDGYVSPVAKLGTVSSPSRDRIPSKKEVKYNG